MKINITWGQKTRTLVNTDEVKQYAQYIGTKVPKISIEREFEVKKKKTKKAESGFAEYQRMQRNHAIDVEHKLIK